MCTTCGCGIGKVRIDDTSTPDPLGTRSDEAVAGETYRYVRVPAAPADSLQARAAGHGAQHWHLHEDGTYHSHSHDDTSAQQPAQVAEAESTAAGTAESLGRMIRVERDLLEKNDAIAVANRRFFVDRGIFALNLVSSPGSGKTTLLEKTIGAWQGRTPIAVIEGDQQTSRDADRVREAGARAVQVNTGKGCHLDAQMVANALSPLALGDGGLLLIENVGNLVCPAAFDLGEAHKVVILSVTEGDDKPLKYPDMFHAADLLVVNKIDLLPHVDFDVAAAIGYARRIRPGIEVILLSARTGEGLPEWLGWLEVGIARIAARREDAVEALRRRLAALESELGVTAAE